MNATRRRPSLPVITLPWLAACAIAWAPATMARQRPVGPGPVIVHSQFGGQIFGFDIDQNGTEGVLSESKLLSGDTVLAAVETFDQATGKILTVVAKTMNKDDFVTLGIAGGSVGVVEQERVRKLYVSKRVYNILDPLNGNAFTGKWTPPLKTDDIVEGFSRNQQSPNTAILAYVNKNAGSTFLFGSNIAQNTSGRIIKLTNPVFDNLSAVQMGYDSTTNEAVAAASQGGVGGPAPVIAIANLATGHLTTFTGLPGPPPYREGSINGLAVDSADSIAVTTTELDFRVEFYDLNKQTGFFVTLPDATGQTQSGSDVEFDPVNRLFLVAQSVSSTSPSGSSIQVYDTLGNLVESLNGFNFSNGSNVIGTHIAINPANRTGYVDGPDPGVTELQSFAY